jgi:hypothetical protein
MKKHLWVLLLAIVVFLGMPIIVTALGVDVSLQAGGGAAMGSSDSDLKTGKLRWSADAGLAMDVYAFDIGSLALGVSVGADYVMLNYYGITDLTTYGAGDRVGEPRYNYVFIPAALVGNMGLKADKSVTVRIGGFAAYFLGGKTDVTYDTQIPIPFQFINGEYDLDDSNTEQWMYGIRAYVGADLFIKGKISISPGIQFDIGLTDATVDLPLPEDTSKDTFWALNALICVKYSLF